MSLKHKACCSVDPHLVTLTLSTRIDHARATADDLRAKAAILHQLVWRGSVEQVIEIACGPRNFAIIVRARAWGHRFRVKRRADMSARGKRCRATAIHTGLAECGLWSPFEYHVQSPASSLPP